MSRARANIGGVSVSAPVAACSTRAALQILDSGFAALGDGVANADYGLWLGSGISLGRVEGLAQLVVRLLEFLRIEATRVDPRGHDEALTSALRLGQMPDDEIAKLDLRTPVDTWPNRDALAHELRSRYSDLLAIPVPGHDADYLLWNGISIADSFPESAEPDSEHLCIAALILEGAFPMIASANWDGLIEKAVKQLAPDNSPLDVGVIADDLVLPHGRSRLLKYHGCALKAVANEVVYRSCLIARSTQLLDFTNAARFEFIRSQLRNMVVSQPTLMIGLSAQDTDVRSIFLQAREIRPWPWPSTPPAGIIATPDPVLSAGQQDVLRAIYTDDVFARHSVSIEQSAFFPVSGKPLLSALLLYVLSQKLRALMHTSLGATWSPADVSTLDDGILAVRDLVACGGVDGHWDDFVAGALTRHTRALLLLRAGRYDPAANAPYQALGTEPVGRIPQMPTLTASGEREFATALALVGVGQNRKCWSVDAPERLETREATLRVTTPPPKGTRSAAQQYRLFFVANENAAVQLLSDGAFSEADEDAVIVHSVTPPPRPSRSPSRPLGRSGKGEARHVYMRTLVDSHTSADGLLNAFMEAGVLV